jgi:hypothetical protein
MENEIILFITDVNLIICNLTIWDMATLIYRINNTWGDGPMTLRLNFSRVDKNMMFNPLPPSIIVLGMILSIIRTSSSIRPTSKEVEALNSEVISTFVNFLVVISFLIVVVPSLNIFS